MIMISSSSRYIEVKIMLKSSEGCGGSGCNIGRYF